MSLKGANGELWLLKGHSNNTWHFFGTFLMSFKMMSAQDYPIRIAIQLSALDFDWQSKVNIGFWIWIVNPVFSISIQIQNFLIFSEFTHIVDLIWFDNLLSHHVTYVTLLSDFFTAKYSNSNTTLNSLIKIAYVTVQEQ